MSAQLLQQISDNYQLACAVHRELADVFWFIYMPGYAMLNEYQLLDESMTQRKIKRYMSSTYHSYMLDNIPKSAKIVEPLIGEKNRKALKQEETWSIIKEAFRIHMEWEESTLQEYQRIAKELFASGEVAAYNFVGDIIKDVKAELVYVTDKVIELTAMGWDMSQIVAEQPDYMERYEYLIRNLLGKSQEYHHYNSMHDAHSRTTVLDKYPD